ncbi:hypothetical protein DFP72DRAFT_890481 [Ephemerocybe angulata]|uniref:Uncharacterized protein n=1 Tax=Ephemerocybe angulata TaxID=980116 RepID=A0A8H6M6L2_9AGAR|nr:hypothetical protein DFP72DRAFT_890481 [Tulosesus angulatus]
MAENRHPGGEPDSAYQIRTAFSSMTVGTPQQQQPLPKLDLASLKKPRSKNNKNKIDSSPFKKRTSAAIAEPKPMSGDRMFNVAGSTGSGAQGYSNHELVHEEQAGQTLTVNVDTTRTQLISPPPEEMLRRNQQRLPPLFTPSLLADDDAQPTPTDEQEYEAEATTRERPRSRRRPCLRRRRRDLEGNLGDVASTSTLSGTGTGLYVWGAGCSYESVEGSEGKGERAGAELASEEEHVPPLRVRLFRPSTSTEDVRESAGAGAVGSVGKARAGRKKPPIPPYEPPGDVFTPPREVTVSPPHTEARRRNRQAPRSSTSRTQAHTEDEDDPLLLSSEAEEMQMALETPGPRWVQQRTPKGKSSSRKTPLDKSTARSTGRRKKVALTPGSARKTVRLESTSVTEAAEVVLEEELDDIEEKPKERKTPDEGNYDWTQGHTQPMESTEDSMMHMDEGDEEVEPVAVGLLDFDAALKAHASVSTLNGSPHDGKPGASASWSDSDSEDELDALGELEGRGEYTGRWRMLKVRVKADPPSEATELRMEEWGRPISPIDKDGREVPPDDDLAEALDEVKEMREEEMERAWDAAVEGMEEDADVLEHEGGEEEEEEEVVRLSTSLEPEDDVPVHPDAPATPAQPFENSSSPYQFHTHYQTSSSHSRSKSQDQTKPLFNSRYQPSYEDDSHREEEEEAQDPVTPLPAARRASAPHKFFDFDRRAPITPVNVQQSQPEYEEHFTPLKKGSAELDVEDEEAQEEGGDDASDLEDLDLGMVKIVSADPRAAARAAAILKQYDYECFTKLSMKQRKEKERRQRRYSSLDDFSQDSRRRNLLGSGIGKSGARDVAEREKARLRQRRSMGVVGERVVIPGSPSVTLPELGTTPMSPLRSQVGAGDGGMRVEEEERTPAGLNTPVQGGERFAVPPAIAAWNVSVGSRSPGERAWTKEEWKLLDSCLTDERMGEGHGGYSPYTQELKEVDEVSVDDVVERFVQAVGGKDVVNGYGSAWSLDVMKQRVRALQNKQRAGNVAPPSTPSAATPSTTERVLGGDKRRASMDVPDFTPLGRRAPPPRKSRPLPALKTTDNAPFATLAGTDRRNEVIHAEVEEMSGQQGETSVEVEPEQASSEPFPSVEQDPADPPVEQPILETPKPRDTSDSSFKTPSTTLGKKIKGIFFSYMPTLSKTAPPPRRQPREAQPGLPLPPPEVLHKNRGPVATPAKAPLPKPKHPKELVELHPVAPAPKPSMIPRWNKCSAPSRLVQLNHVSPVPAPGAAGAPKPRRSSGASVKDLVRGFEEIKKVEEEEVRRSYSRSGRRSGEKVFAAPGTLMGLSRPGWK